ncbi:amino acid ABC transporter substrate-binding protein (PAAT family) [Paraburkholderia sp. BL6665CI2N2]|uniref:ABC transporter substrate-binding protein n=1 Tax=Paraburkholderia sp. BL6665CI2N2 TaxID=1938806 RepID=UPI001066011D|nr:ABC transporter substrate-binding protein [Paraburkholderia sp. BL6665CI2N2]TDY17102.1 amino acid ABC transporter substrate-binding protein (PAAT family) [Paraburkholderia sp. BL6665CI2N2]
MKSFCNAVAIAVTFVLSTAFAVQAHADTKLTKLLPQSIRDSGTLRVIASPGSPPMQYFGKDGSTLEGMEIDLTYAVADVLGVKLSITNGTFDSLIPSIAAGRADVAVGSIGDLKSRQTQVDFIDYVKAGIGMASLKGNGAGIKNLASLCGKKIATVRGTFQERELAAQQAKCQAAGSQLEIQTFTDDSGAVLALRSGRADVWSGDTAAVGYAVRQFPNTLEAVGEMRTIALLGYVVSKSNAQLRDAVKAALDELQANGKYQQILDKWGQGATRIEKISINDAWL